MTGKSRAADRNGDLICIKAGMDIPDLISTMRMDSALRAKLILAIYQMARSAGVALALFVACSIGAAQACSQNNSASFRATALHKVERSAVPVKTEVTSVMLVPRTANPQRLYTDPSCAFHSHGAACGSGCCFTGFASIEALSSSLYLPLSSTRIVPHDQAEASASGPPPNFRPPRNFI